VTCTRNIVAQNPPDSGATGPTVTPGHAVTRSSATSSLETVTVFTVAVISGIVEGMASVTPAAAPSETAEEWTVDELGRLSGLPVRTIREYQTIGLLPAPRRSGRVGLYGPSHLRRLQLIARLQERGYSLAGIGDLLAAWRDGDAIGDVLGLEPDQLVHVDEPGAPATLAQLTELLPSLVPDRLDDLVATGIVEACGPDRYCVPSPSLLQLGIDALAAGLAPDDVLALFERLRAAADTAAETVLDAFGGIPRDTDDATTDAIVARGRGLLAHGVGRLTLHRLARRVGADEHSTNAEIATLLRSRVRPTTKRRSR
jgi:DNA-binding transcriptional MerR regulator